MSLRSDERGRKTWSSGKPREENISRRELSSKVRCVQELKDQCRAGY